MKLRAFALAVLGIVGLVVGCSPDQPPKKTTPVAKAAKNKADTDRFKAPLPEDSEPAASASEAPRTNPNVENPRIEEVLADPIGQKAPSAAGVSDGKKFDLKNLSGKVVVLKFGATWCGPCKAMIPHLKELNARMKDKPFALVDVDVDENPELAERWNIAFVPAVYVIDGEGVIRNVNVRDQELDKAVDDLMVAAGK